MTPTVGRIVHVEHEWRPGCRAAIITRVHPELGVVDVTIFDPDVGPVGGSTLREGRGSPSWYWHWPEREEDDGLNRDR